MTSFQFFVFVFTSILLFKALAQVKTEVGALISTSSNLFPNLNLDGILARAFSGVTQDTSGNFLVGLNSDMIVRFAPGSNIASLFAGLGSSITDGVQATSTGLFTLASLAGDTAGNVYTSETNRNCIRRIGVNGAVITFAGSCGSSSAPSDNVAATTTFLNRPGNIFYHTQTNNLYIADTNFHRIRMVRTSNNIITTVMGTSQGDTIDVVATSALINGPRDVWVDTNGVMYVADWGNNRILRATSRSAIVTRFAGSGTSSSAAFYPTGVAGTSAVIGRPVAITGDTSGNIFFSSGGSASVLFRCSTTNNIVFSFERAATSGVIHGAALPNFAFSFVNQLLISRDGRLTVTDSGNNGGFVAQLPRLFNSTSIVRISAGYPSISTKSYPATSLVFGSVASVWSDTSGALYVVDASALVIVKKSSSGIVTHVAGTRQSFSLAPGSTAVAVSSRISGSLSAILGDTAGNLYYSHETGICRISSTGILSVTAGTNVSTGCIADWNYAGPATSVNLCATRGLALSTNGELYFSDDAYVIRKLVLSSGILSTIAGGGVRTSFSVFGVGFVGVIHGLWLDAPRSLLYAADEMHIVRRINLADGNPNRTVTIYAGRFGNSTNGGNNLPARSSGLNSPRGICGSSNGDVYVTQLNQFYIRVVFAVNQMMQYYVGTGVSGQVGENTSPLSTPVASSRGCFVDEARDTLYYVQLSSSYGVVRSSTPLAVAPSQNPTVSPTAGSSQAPSDSPSVAPSIAPSVPPSINPSVMPTAAPSGLPTVTPTLAPSMSPSVTPSVAPTVSPTLAPSQLPTVLPTLAPSISPSVTTTTAPTVSPTLAPSQLPTALPTLAPSNSPSVTPSVAPTVSPTLAPSQLPTVMPTVVPSRSPSVTPSAAPSVLPTTAPTRLPTVMPTLAPSNSPSVTPSVAPTASPTVAPSQLPTVMPTVVPSMSPSVTPTAEPSVSPTVAPSQLPTVTPTQVPSNSPSIAPSQLPTAVPTVAPSNSPTETPTVLPSALPSFAPSQLPTVVPTVAPSSAPSISPSDLPSETPSQMPSAIPTVTPSVLPSVTPTVSPSCLPTVIPTVSPSAAPSIAPSHLPSITPTLSPSAVPTVEPTVNPTASPSERPTAAPSFSPSVAPSASPTVQTTSTVRFESTWAFKLNSNNNNGKSSLGRSSGSTSSQLRTRALVPYELSVADQQAIIQTQAVVLQTSPNNIVYVSAQQDDVTLLIYVKTLVALNLIDYAQLNNNETRLFQQATSILTEAVQSGSFLNSLLLKAAEMNSTSFGSSVVTAVLFSDPTVIPAPKYDEDVDKSLSVGQVAGLVVGSIVGTMLLMLATYGVFVWIARHSSAL